ncbi:MAG: aldo/keto reductase [Kiritimatiellia bacterium]
MEKMRLGKTGLSISRTAFGVLPLQRTPMAEAVRILRRAYEAGITFYDTARAYTDSEEKLGNALSGVRDSIVIATKSGATDRDGVLRDLETSLRNLKTDHVDILQLHNPGALPNPDDTGSSRAALAEAREQGLIRFAGITNHSRGRAAEAVSSGLYDTLQFPLSYLSSDEDLALIEQCRLADMGIIAMKPLSGGLLNNARASFAYLRQWENVVPIWGIQRMSELEEFIDLENNPPVLDDRLLEVISSDREELGSEFCRACGYCLPCPADIPIPMAARMSLLLRRMPYQKFLEAEWEERMSRIEKCTECGHCRDNCPYGLDTPALLKKNLADYREFRNQI